MKPKRSSKTKRLSKAQGSSLDRISSLPQNIIETILCLVPLRDAVRTSILAWKWRYNWTKIPKLVFNEKDMFTKSANEQTYKRVQLVKHELARPVKSADEPENERMQLTKRCKVFYAIYQVLLLHQGPIVEFTLDMDTEGISVEIDQIITHLSRLNTVKKFTLKLPWFEPWLDNYSNQYKLPLSFFSLHLLTDIYIHGCNLDIKPTFGGFRNLTNIFLQEVSSNRKTLLHLVSSCRLLKTFSLLVNDGEINDYDDDNVTNIDLFEASRMIEHLSFTGAGIKAYVGDSVPRELPTALVNLKYLCITDMILVEKFMLSILGLLIRSSPYLEKLKLEIQVDCSEIDESEVDAFTLEDYSDIWLQHLNELEVLEFVDWEPVLAFVELILAKSPILKKVNILLAYGLPKETEIKLLKNLLRCPRASPVAEISVERPYRKEK